VDAQSLFDSLPFAQRLGIDLESVGEGRAVGTLELEDHHSSVPWTTVAHGGVTYSLADTVGGSAVFSLYPKPTPTIDMRIDYTVGCKSLNGFAGPIQRITQKQLQPTVYLSPATEALRAEAEVVKDGDSVAVVSVEVTNAAGDLAADARGMYKTDGGKEKPPGPTAATIPDCRRTRTDSRPRKFSGFADRDTAEPAQYVTPNVFHGLRG
jgi:acyl-coenzyme A thioesterase PaaI-like protein